MEAEHAAAPSSLELQLVREFADAVAASTAEAKGARVGGDNAAQLELDRGLCRLYEREAEITSRLEDAHEGAILTELERVHYLMFMLETFVWLQLSDDGAQSRRPIDFVLEGGGERRAQRVRFLAGELASCGGGADWPFAGSGNRLTQQSVVCYLLPRRHATQYASYCSVPTAFQHYTDAFREVDELMEEHASRQHPSLLESHNERLDAVLKHALAAELSVSGAGRADALVVPTPWKWRLLHDVVEVEQQAEGLSAEGENQAARTEPYSYRLWLMLHTGLTHLTHADNLLELKLSIHNTGVANALGALLRLRKDTTSKLEVQQIVRVCAERWELPQLAALPLQDWLAAAIDKEIAVVRATDE